jgi:hypothetical protein
MNNTKLKKENIETCLKKLTETINAIKNPDEMEAIVKKTGSSWFKYYSKNDLARCEIFNDFYKEFRLKAQKLGVDISKYPEDLSKLANYFNQQKN